MDLADLTKISFPKNKQFLLIAGPCLIEGEEMAMQIAERVKNISDKLSIPYVFKGSFKKANRSRIDSFTGIGDDKALKILKKVGERSPVEGYDFITKINDMERNTQIKIGGRKRKYKLTRKKNKQNKKKTKRNLKKQY